MQLIDFFSINLIKIDILIFNQITPRLEKMVKEEMGKVIQSQVSARLLDPLRELISREVAERLKSTENMIKDSVGKLFKSKSVMDSLGTSVMTSMQGTVVNSYRDCFQKIIVPNFEKSCQNMYQQVNQSFAKGTQDYLTEFDQMAKQHRKMFEDNKEPIIAQMKQYQDQIQNHGTQLGSQITSNLQQQVDAQLRNSNAVLQDTIISSVKAIIKEELQLAMRDQQNTLPDKLINQMRQSGTITPINVSIGGDMASQQNPVNVQDLQLQITAFLKKGLINSAFQTALCAADLNLLENVCELVNPSQAFDQSNPKAKLQQPVILSLIQQLSQDLNSNTELKMKYLAEALVNLDLNIPLTIEHSPTVINQLVNKLQQFIQLHPSDKVTSQMRMLIMAGKSVLSAPIISTTNAMPKQQSLLNSKPMGQSNMQQQQSSISMNSQQFKKSLMHHDNY